MEYPQEDLDGFFVWGNLLLHLECKLIWAINSKIVSLKLPDANQYCQDLNLDGFDEWTIPTASEMQAVLANHIHSKGFFILDDIRDYASWE